MKKLYIGICDDEAIILDKLKQIVTEHLESKKIDFKISEFHSGIELLENASLYDIVFLDIYMPGMDGYETGKHLKKVNPNCKVVMATGMKDQFKEAFKIGAVRYITKPFDVNEVHEAIDSILFMRAGMETIELYCNGMQYEIEQKDIKYVIAYDGYVVCEIRGEKYRKEASLKQMEEILDKRIFLRMNKQYIVNFMWIEKHKDGAVWIKSEKHTKIMASRRKKKEFEKAYMLYDVNAR